MSRTGDQVADFIRAHMPLAPVPGVPGIVLHTNHPGSGLRRLTGADVPYWAYQWAGGTVLARHILGDPATVEGRSVMDLGAGSGLVAIAAARAGAARALAAEVDPQARVAIELNAAANGVGVTTVGDDLLDGPPPAADVVLVSDLFYADDLAARLAPFLDRCVAAGIAVLVGDPYRKPLPLDRLTLIAEAAVPDFGAKTPVRSGVFSWRGS